MNVRTVYLDVSNLLEQTFLTGIQRVVREVAVRLLHTPGLQIKLLRNQQKKLCFEVIPETVFREALAGRLPGKNVQFPALTPEQLIPGSVFYDIDAVWGSQPQRAWLYPLLRKQGVMIATFVHDIIPITEPQYCYPNTVCQFMNYTGAVLSCADSIFVSTQATANAVHSLQRQVESPATPIAVTGLGADFAPTAAQGNISQDVKQAVDGKPYVLLVSTLEPRKNHTVLLDAFEHGLFDAGMVLVFAGRIGWGVEELEKRIQSHPQRGKQFFHFSGQNDATIDYLYRHAFVTAYPSFNEGFGLPVIESLERGVPVVASDRAVLREVGRNDCLYCDPDNPGEWAELFARLLHNPEEMAAWRQRLKDFQAPTWDEAAANMAEALRRLEPFPPQ